MLFAQAGEVEFRLAHCNDDDAAKFCGLFNSLYARKVDGAYYRWQFFSTAPPSYLCFAQNPSGDLLGCYGLHVFETNRADRKLAWALDIMIASASQHKGLLRPLVNFAYAMIQERDPIGISVMANQRAYEAHVYGLGWAHVQTLVTHVNSTLPSVGRSKRLKFSRISQWTEEVETDLQLIDAKLSQSGLLAVKRTTAYLNWRFVNNAWYQYDIFQAHDSLEPFGFLVLKIFRDPKTGETFGDIVDILWSRDDPAALFEMLLFAIRHLMDRGAKSVTSWFRTNTMLDQVGQLAGFMPTAGKRFHCVKPLDTQFAGLAEHQNWYVTMSDAEIY